MTLLGPSEIRALAERLDVTPTKKLGQNFVHDHNTVRRIVTAAGVAPGDRVLEVGPGLGSLTLALLDAGAHLTAVEIDHRLAAELPATVARHAPGVTILSHTSAEADAEPGTEPGAEPDAEHAEVTAPSLTVVVNDVLRVTALPTPPEIVVANLPYNVTVPVLLHLLATFPSIRRALVMVQAEVGERIAAGPGSKVYGAPSVKAAWFGDWRLAGTVNRTVFWPVPNVDSVLVAFEAHEVPGTEEERARTFRLVDAAFQQRRKMLRQALVPVLGTEASATLQRAGIDPTLRGEQLSLGAFLALARASTEERPRARLETAGDALD